MGIQGGAGKGLGETENGKKGFNQQTSLWESRKATHDSDPPQLSHHPISCSLPPPSFLQTWYPPSKPRPAVPGGSNVGAGRKELELHIASVSFQESQEQVVS